MKEFLVPLDEVHTGLKCIVESVESKGMLRRRMLDLGIIKGTVVEVLQESPAGDPIAYFIRGTVIALRNEDARKIKVKI